MSHESTVIYAADRFRQQGTRPADLGHEAAILPFQLGPVDRHQAMHDIAISGTVTLLESCGYPYQAAKLERTCREAIENGANAASLRIIIDTTIDEIMEQEAELSSFVDTLRQSVDTVWKNAEALLNRQRW